jgi:hypothetical protein
VTSRLQTIVFISIPDRGIGVRITAMQGDAGGDAMMTLGLALDIATGVAGGPGARAHVISRSALMSVPKGALRPGRARSTLAPPTLVSEIVDTGLARRLGLTGPA